MIKLNRSRWFLASLLTSSFFFFVSCEKEAVIDNITSNDGIQARLAYTDKGYTEVEVNPIVKINCYFSVWDKDVITPVSGLFEYYDSDGSWVASIDFGDGTCDEWAYKTWDIDAFPDYPSGTDTFSVFDYKDKK
jgi:hypothetical protein